MLGITDRQYEVAQVLHDYYVKYGVWPTLKDLCTRLGITQKGARDHLFLMDKKGIVCRVEREESGGGVWRLRGKFEHQALNNRLKEL